MIANPSGNTTYVLIIATAATTTVSAACGATFIAVAAAATKSYAFCHPPRGTQGSGEKSRH